MSRHKCELRIAYVTAGAAGMLCGSCLRDNALANGLLDLGCDVTLIPTYTPVRVEGHDASMDRVFFGGINVYLQQKFSLFRNLPAVLDRPLDNPSLLRRVASGGIETDARMLGELTLSMLEGSRGNQAKEVVRLVDFLQSIRPQIVNLTNVLIGGTVGAMKSGLDAPVVVTLQGDDLFLNQLGDRYRDRALGLISKIVPRVDGFIVFSRYYGEFMSELLGLPPERIHRLPLGVDLEGFPATLPSPALQKSQRRIGYLARVCPEKGFDRLVDAFVELKRLPGMDDVVLDTAGWLDTSNRAFLREQEKKIDAAGLKDVFHYRGVLDRDEKIAFLCGLTLFSVPSVYREPKGLYVLEALGCGVPVVQPRHGAFPELIESSGGGVLVRPQDTTHLVRELAGLLGDPRRMADLGREGHANVHARHSSRKMAEATLEVYRRILGPSVSV